MSKSIPSSSHAPQEPNDPQFRPRDLKLSLPAQELHITWEDGGHSRFDLRRLRRVCPCATCRRERAAPPTQLPILSNTAGDRPIEVINAELMGHYAIHLQWTDGHDTGIYDFRYLRTLDQPADPGSSAASRSS